LARFVVTVSDRPGGITELATIISSMGISIKDIFHERAFLKSEIFNVQVKCVVETRDQEHSDELHRALKAHYPSGRISWGPHFI
jgi:threonine dehydratase